MTEILFTLVIGSYLFTAWVFRYFSARLERVVSNHLHAIAEQIAKIAAEAAVAALRAGEAEKRLETLERGNG